MELDFKNKVPIKLENLPIPYRLDRKTRWKLCKMMKKVDKNVNFYLTRPLSHEIINFIDGKRTVSNITNAVGYEYGLRIKAEHVLIFLLHLKEEGYLTFKK